MPKTHVKKRRGHRGRNRSLSPERESQMVAEYFTKDEDVVEIAARYGVSHQTLYNAVDRSGPGRRMKKEAS